MYNYDPIIISKSYDIFIMILDIEYSTKNELLINSGIEQKGMT